MVLAGLGVSDFNLSFLQTCVSVLIGDQFSGGIWVWWAVYMVSSGMPTEIRRILSPADPWFPCPDGNVRMPIGPGIWREVVVLLVLEICRHSWETSSLLAVFVYVALWHRISSGCIQKMEQSCPMQPLGSCDLRVPNKFLWAAVVILPALTSLSILLGTHSLLVLFKYGVLWQMICYRQRPKFFLCWVFVWFRYQSDSGLIEWWIR